jgi:hypothetical protein
MRASTTPAAAVPGRLPSDQRQRYLTNREAAEFLRLSPRTLEKQRVLGGGPRYRKFGRRVLYAFDDLEAWSNAHVFHMTCDPDTPVAQR